MALITWSDDLRLGVAEIDRQHRHLIETANQLHDAVAAGRGASIVSDILDELVIYSATHFRMEERFFTRFEYPNAAEHRQEHVALIGKINEFANAFNAQAPDSRSRLASELLDLLGIWLRYHMMETDAQFVRLARLNRVDLDV